MPSAPTTNLADSMETERSRAPADRHGATSTVARCFHCGLNCRESSFAAGEKNFCCQGCLTVFELLTGHGLEDYYTLGESAGVRVKAAAVPGQFNFLDEPAVRERLVDFTNGRMTRVTLHLPSIHCIACVWLLENLFRLKPGIGQSQVNFPRKEVAVSFEDAQLRLSELAALLASLGYEPELKFSDLQATRHRPTPRRLWLQLAVAGFAFGNIMLFSLSSYLGLDSFNGPAFRQLMGWFSLVLATPVFFYSAADYWRAAWVSLRQRLLTIDVPIAAGIAAIYGQSIFEVVTGRGEGYFDSLAGLLFFLLCGKLFQQKTYDRLAFDLDYRSFFPLSVTRKLERRLPARRDDGRTGIHAMLEAGASSEERVSLSQLAVGDHLILRNGELIPADARLLGGPALIDYSFVTGESEPVEKKPGDCLYAGGRQIGGAIEVEMTKAVSQSYLTSLWNQEAFRKDKADTLDNLTNRYSRRFTRLVIAIALGAAAYWAFADSTRAVKAFTSVLIVACPCALALAAPFALGTAVRLLGRRKVFLKNAHVVERLAKVEAVVFDKTGTLTAAGAGSVSWDGAPLKEAEERWLYSMTRHSTHPLAVRIGEAIAREHFPDPVRSFLETAGCGMEGSVVGNEIWMGSAAWLESRGLAAGVPPAAEPGVPPGGRGVHTFDSQVISEQGPGGRMPPSTAGGTPAATGSAVHVAINGKYRGCFHLAGALRPEADQLIGQLARDYELALLSGDNAKEHSRFMKVFGSDAQLRFNQSPLDKLGFIRELQQRGRTVMMVGDGLNDAGALQQSDVGVAVVENVSAFAPASDVIAASSTVPRLAGVLRFARDTVRVVRAAFLVSAAYNVIGIAIAASGRLSPVVCAVLMPLSSITVVAFACGATTWAARRSGQGKTIAKDVESRSSHLDYERGPA
jgi:Cu+-exporting ATPase